jgi:hypothetical protein
MARDRLCAASYFEFPISHFEFIKAIYLRFCLILEVDLF